MIVGGYLFQDVIHFGQNDHRCARRSLLKPFRISNRHLKIASALKYPGRLCALGNQNGVIEHDDAYQKPLHCGVEQR